MFTKINTVDPSKYSITWRKPYELYSAIVWLLSAPLIYTVGLLTNAPIKVVSLFAFIAVAMAGLRYYQGQAVIELNSRVGKDGKKFITLPELIEITKAKPKEGSEEQIYIGDGFDWTLTQRQSMQDLLVQNPSTVLPPEFTREGARWLHLLSEPKKQFVPDSLFNGHTLIAGTTGAGKTRIFDLLISQYILKNKIVIVIDPKGDREMRENMRRACKAVGREFLEFNPAFPDRGVRFDPLKNWNRQTEPASRIASLIPSETGSDPFTAFSWKVLNDISSGFLYTETSPTLVKFRKYVENGVDELLQNTLETFFNKSSKAEIWKSSISDMKAPKMSELDKYIEYYETRFTDDEKQMDVNGLIASYKHSREHLQKMIASLIPVLGMLTSGPLESLLSPSPDLNDPRPIYDFNKVIKQNKVLYVGLDSLSDRMVGSALGSILLADMTAVAGDRYNYMSDDEIKATPIYLFVDEVPEIINDPMIQILNKARGAGYKVFMATQTLADFEARLGNASKARQTIANCNNNIVLRLKDGETAKYFAESLPMVPIKSLTFQYQNSVDPDISSTGASKYGESLQTESDSIFPDSGFAMLPDLNYMGIFKGGRLMKLEIPILIEGSKSV